MPRKSSVSCFNNPAHKKARLLSTQARRESAKHFQPFIHARSRGNGAAGDV
jgi:hypothetical protein